MRTVWGVCGRQVAAALMIHSHREDAFTVVTAVTWYLWGCLAVILT